MTEAEIISGCKKNRRDAQELLFRKYRGRILGISMRYTVSNMEAEDIMQETFIKIFNHIGRYSPTGSFEGWIKRIAVNTAIEHYRKNRKILLVDELPEEKEPAFDFNIIDKMAAAELTRIINLLPEGYKMIFNLYAVEGYNHREIGEMLDIAEGTSKSQYARARAYLIRLLQQELHLNQSFYVAR